MKQHPIELDKRKAFILATVVYEYIATAEPVGSHTLTQKYNLGDDSQRDGGARGRGIPRAAAYVGGAGPLGCGLSDVCRPADASRDDRSRGRAADPRRVPSRQPRARGRHRADDAPPFQPLEEPRDRD